jgi:hypothetical protein
MSLVLVRSAVINTSPCTGQTLLPAGTGFECAGVVLAFVAGFGSPVVVVLAGSAVTLAVGAAGLRSAFVAAVSCPFADQHADMSAEETAINPTATASETAADPLFIGYSSRLNRSRMRLVGSAWKGCESGGARPFKELDEI